MILALMAIHVNIGTLYFMCPQIPAFMCCIHPVFDGPHLRPQLSLDSHAAGITNPGLLCIGKSIPPKMLWSKDDTSQWRENMSEMDKLLEATNAGDSLQ